MTRQLQRNYFDGELSSRPSMSHYRGWGVAKTPIGFNRGLNFAFYINNHDYMLVLHVYKYQMEHIEQLVYIVELFHEQSIHV